MIQPLEIKNEIKNRPPAQREVAGKNYHGLKVSWKLVFKNVYPSNKKDFIQIHAWPESESELVMYPDLFIEIEKDKYPEINTLKEDQIFMVTGEIFNAEMYKITLGNCVLDFDIKTEKNSTLSNGKIKNAVISEESSLVKFKEKHNKNFWEKPWFQIIILISAIATIFGVFR